MSDTEQQSSESAAFKYDNPLLYKVFANIATLMGMNEVSLRRVNRVASENRQMIKNFASLECAVKECLDQISHLIKNQSKSTWSKVENLEKSVLQPQPNESIIDELQKEESRHKIESPQVKTEDSHACQLEQHISRITRLLNRTGLSIKNSSAFSNDSIVKWSEFCLMRVQMIREICTLIGHPMVSVAGLGTKTEESRLEDDTVKVESDNEADSEQCEAQDPPEKIEITPEEICLLEKREIVIDYQRREDAPEEEKSMKRIKDVRDH